MLGTFRLKWAADEPPPQHAVIRGWAVDTVERLEALLSGDLPDLVIIIPRLLGIQVNGRVVAATTHYLRPSRQQTRRMG
jgi:hypothetical protein